MKITIEINENNKVTIKKDKITIEEVIDLMNYMGVESSNKHAQGSDLKSDDINIGKDNKEQRSPINEPKRSRQLPLTRNSESEGFKIADFIEEDIKFEEDDDDTEEYRQPYGKNVQAKGTCPECSAVTIDNVPEYFNHIKCKDCSTKIYLIDLPETDDDGNDKVGNTKYFTRRERNEYKLKTEIPKTEEEILNYYTHNVIKEAMREFTLYEINRAAEEEGLSGHRYLNKPEMIEYVINHGGYVDDDAIKFKN